MRLMGQTKQNKTTMTAVNDVEQQFLALLERNKNTIYKVCLMYSNEQDSINDNYQEVVLNMWKAYAKFRHDSKESTWVYQIALNTCISQLRHRTAHPELQPITIDVAQLVDESEEHRSQVMELYRLINRLTDLEKAIIMLWLDEKSYDEIAEVTGISKSNVGVRINRIKEKLRQMSNE